MSNEDRTQRAFDDLRAQTAGIEPPGIASDLQRVPRTPRGLVPALAAAAITVLVIGLVVVLRGPAPDGPLAGATDGTVAQTTVSQPAIEATITVPPDSSVVSTASDSTATTLSSVVAPAIVGTGWRVVGVATDDVLNVRANGGVQYPIIGSLAHDDVDVVLSGWGSTQVDGTGWWGVRLADGTEGFVNRRFLAPPAGWLVDSLGCDLSDAVASEMQMTTAMPVTGSDATGILALLHDTDGECDRVTVVLGSGPAYGVGVDAEIVPGGLKITAIPGEVTVDFLDTAVRNVAVTAANELFESGIVITSVPGGNDTSLAPRVHIFTSIDRKIESITTLDYPARIVISFVDTDSGTRPYLVSDDGPTLIIGADVISGSLLRVRGFARWFEAQGIAMLFDAKGHPYPASWTGSSVADGAFGHTAGVFAPWSPTWGEFVFQVETIPPGDYTLFVGDFCLVDEANDEWAECGVTIPFTMR